MKYFFFIFISIIFFQTVYGKSVAIVDTLALDLDHDKKLDTVIFAREKGIIICKLSSQNFKDIKTLPLDFEENHSYLSESGAGFSFSVPWMRAGYHLDFTYNKSVKKLQLVAMDRYEFGPANNDGSGESSINLITNEYKGDWNYYDLDREELIKIPTIKKKMIFPKTYLDGFSDSIAYDYSGKCADIFNAEKTRLLKVNALEKETSTWKNYYPFPDKNYVISIKKSQSTTDGTIYFLHQTKAKIKLIWKENISIGKSLGEETFEDFNGDGIKDLLIFSNTGGRGANLFYHLYLLHPKLKKVNKVVGFEDVVNPSYNKKYHVIEAYGYAGTNGYSIYRITKDNKVKQLGKSFEDDFDSDETELNRRIEKIVKNEKHP